MGITAADGMHGGEHDEVKYVSRTQCRSISGSEEDGDRDIAFGRRSPPLAPEPTAKGVQSDSHSSQSSVHATKLKGILYRARR